MAISLKPDFTFFSGHPALKTVCQEMPELMNQILTQSFANITALSDTFPLLHFLPQSENNDPLSHAWELEKAKQCYFEAFPTTRYFSIENYASVRAATFNMIVSRVYRKFDLLETYPASDDEESRLDSTRIRSTASNLRPFQKMKRHLLQSLSISISMITGKNSRMVTHGFPCLSGEKESPKQKWLIHL